MSLRFVFGTMSNKTNNNSTTTATKAKMTKVTMTSGQAEQWRQQMKETEIYEQDIIARMHSADGIEKACEAIESAGTAYEHAKRSAVLEAGKLLDKWFTPTYEICAKLKKEFEGYISPDEVQKYSEDSWIAEGEGQELQKQWERVEHSKEWVPTIQRVEVSKEEIEAVGKEITTFTKLITAKLGGIPDFSGHAEMQMTDEDRFVVFKVIGDDNAIYFLT
jgi:hypothetical protein